MSVLSQSTIANKISLSGVGVHTGKTVNINILPSPPNSGIMFKRIDLKEKNIVIPTFDNVVDATLCTTLSNQYDVKVSTVEHLMGALYGLGIDNLVVEVNSQELPILDGSAKVFIAQILSTGIKSSSTPIKLIKIEKQISYKEGSKSISLDKSKVASEIDFEIKFKNQIIGTQRNKINIFNDDLKNIFESRTFCLFEDVEKLKAAGLAQGGSLDNAIVVGEKEILNSDGLRNPKEFVNHKILDCMGDLYLVGYRLIGSLKCRHGGHSLTNKLLRKIFSDNKNYSLLEIKGKNLPHSLVKNRYNLKSIA